MLALTKDNKLIHIKNALVKTDYYCDKCGGILRVRNGKIRMKHFYHLERDCGSKGESLIHKYWKDYFLNLKEFDGYNITDQMEEVYLKNTGYTPDVVLKTDKETYIVIEVCYKNPKDESYKDKFIHIKNLERVYEVEVDFEKILNTKILFDIEKVKRIEKKRKELKKDVERKRRYIIKKYYKDGGLVFDDDHRIPYIYLTLAKDLKPKYGYAESKFSKGRYYRYIIRNSLRCKTFKCYLVENIDFEDENISVKSKSFYIYIYDYKNLSKHLNWYGHLGELYSTDEELKGNISIVLDDEEIKKLN